MPRSTRLLRPTVRLLIGAGILACTVWFARQQWHKRQLILQENQAVELQNQDQYAQAATLYEALLPRAQGEQAARLRGNLAVCYVAMAEDPAIPVKDGLELYRKAHALDPKAVTNPAILKRLSSGP